MNTNVPVQPPSGGTADAPMDRLTACLVRVVLAMFAARRLELDVATDLLSAMVACDREHRSEL